MNQKTKGILCIIISAFFFALMSVFVRLAGDLPSVQKSFFRNLVAIFFAAGILLRSHQPVSLNRERWTALFLRSFFGTVGVLCNYYAVDHLVLSDATMLSKLSPFFAILFSFFLLKEKVSLFQGVAVVVAFCGALLIIRPTGLNMDVFPALMGLCGGMTAGFAYTMVRVLGKQGVPGPFIVFFFSAFSCIFTLPFLVLDFHPMSWNQLSMLLLAGCSAAAAQFAITTAYRCAPARELSVFDYSQVGFSAILGFFLFHQVPDALSWLGYLVILATALAVFFRDRRSASASC
jgi:drug/metabolite transporter (DMT)-like permease